MSEFHLKNPGTFTEHRQRIQTFRKTGNLKHLYRNELEKACFANDETYSYKKNSAKKSSIWWISDGITNYGL